MESIQAYTQRQMAKYDTNHDNVIMVGALQGLPLGGSWGGYDPSIKSEAVDAPNARRKFFQLAVNPAFNMVADQVSFSQAVQTHIDTNHDNQISLLEKVKAWFKFRLW